jgi:integrative and conjugative element protein (TIGR02256 family)
VPKLIVFSERAYVALLTETKEKFDTETGGVFLGSRDGDIWYIIESIDPGPKSIFKATYFEYDDGYINHLGNKINKLYRNCLVVIGLWHRHPGSFDRFSTIDDETNKDFAMMHKDGAISALVNIDPDFRITLYHVAQPHYYEKVCYEVGDDKIPAHLLEYKSTDLLINKLGSYSRGEQTFHVNKSKKFKDSFCGDLYLRNALDNFFLIPKNCNNIRLNDDIPLMIIEHTDYENVLEELQSDLDFFESNGIGYSMCIGVSGTLEIKETGAASNKNPISILFYKSNIWGSVCLLLRFLSNFIPNREVVAVFKYNNTIFRYERGFFQKVCENYLSSRSVEK